MGKKRSMSQKIVRQAMMSLIKEVLDCTSGIPVKLAGSWNLCSTVRTSDVNLMWNGHRNSIEHSSVL